MNNQGKVAKFLSSKYMDQYEKLNSLEKQDLTLAMNRFLHEASDLRHRRNPNASSN